MSNNFDWRTEEDFDWDQPVEEPQPERPKGGRRRWLGVLVVALLIGGLAFYMYRQVEQRADENLEAMRADIISSHNLLRLAEEEQDDELFFSLLSGRDAGWTAVQHKLFQARSLRNRVPFGMQNQSGEPQSQDNDDQITVTFSPDLLAADVTSLLPYEIQIGNGLTQTIILAETVQYRLGRERWLLSPPDADFWGPQESLNGTRIMLSYPERDQEVAQQLLPALERKLEELCGTLAGIECSPGMKMRITLSSDPQTLIDAARPQSAELVDGGLQLDLPAPTLVGIPQDEDGFQALFRGYAAQMATGVIAQQVGYECCEKLPFFQTLTDYQLSQLALKAWPVSDEDYARILKEQIGLQDYAPLWRSENPQDLVGQNGWQVYVLIDYLLDTLPDTDPLALQRELTRKGSYRSWLNELFAEQNDLGDASLLSDLTRGFWMRGYKQTLNALDEWHSEPPAQDLYLTCTAPGQNGETGQDATLYRYDPDVDAWNGIYETPNILWTAPLPGDTMLLQQEFDEETRRWTAAIRQDDRLTPLLPSTEEYTISFAQTDPAASGLAAYIFQPGGEEATITWFDLLDCQESVGCTHRELPGIPLWAPDGAQALFTDDPNSQIDLLRLDSRTVLFNRRPNNISASLFLGGRDEFLEGEPLVDTDELTQAGKGHAPFWLDNDTIAYVTGEGDPMVHRGSRVISSSVDNNNAQLLFTLNDMTEQIEGGVNTQRLFWIHYVSVHPDNPDQLFAVVFSAFNSRAHVLAFDRASGEVQYLMSAGYLAEHSLGLSPDGRYLVLTGMDESDPNRSEESTLLQVYDLERQEIIPFLSLTADFPPFSTFDWSQDGKWLALQLDDGIIGFFAPDSRNLRLVETPTGECGTPAWIN